MITIKSFIKYDNANCIEVTWVETLEEVETVVHCQAYADVQIGMLRADAEKYGTSLEEYEELIAEVEAGIVLPTPEEIYADIIKHKIQEAQAYLNNTDWVKDYKLRHDLNLDIIPEDSSKWDIIKQREEYITFLKENK